MIGTSTSRVVLVLGRFTHERKAVLEVLREELRKREYLPILFDFELPKRRNVTATVTLLARMARFIVADLTDPSSIPQELQAIILSVRVPVQPLLLEGSSLDSMFKDFDRRISIGCSRFTDTRSLNSCSQRSLRTSSTRLKGK